MDSGSGGGASFLRQLSGRDKKNSSKRWSKKGPSEKTMKQMEGLNTCDNGGVMVRKRVMVIIDQSTRAKHAMMWALTHVANKGDLLTLLQIIPPQKKAQRKRTRPYFADSSSPHLANSLASLCKACRPEVEVEALLIQGPRLATVISQVKKLGASVLILGQHKHSPVSCFFRGRSENFVEQCINNAECLTMAVRKQSRDVGGYLISTRWQKNFWLLA
ncbi:uncharacterized protein LOC131237444 [Magnolia sinica]|uniref:uncharacterized protein LOC131237444 n=1 Tax=Magnolia sinica TaxID=86752 RepID=UPI002659180B|nr:uncharacterized protein LOC131237444 [Magnolia sinica]